LRETLFGSANLDQILGHARNAIILSEFSECLINGFLPFILQLMSVNHSSMESFYNFIKKQHQSLQELGTDKTSDSFQSGVQELVNVFIFQSIKRNLRFC